MIPIFENVDPLTASLTPAKKLGQGNIFRSVCQQFCPGGVRGRGVCMAGRACMAGGHVWQGGMCGRVHV